MGRRNRQRTKLVAPVSAYEAPAAGVLALRGALKAGARRDYTETLAAGIDREDARQRATELLFERLAVSWEIAGVTTTSARDLLERYRMASGPEREFVRVALRRHVEENFPELEAP